MTVRVLYNSAFIPIGTATGGMQLQHPYDKLLTVGESKIENPRIRRCAVSDSFL
ncbi:hypothetical protein [Treponema phagedenis]|uniref:hypothetical protein n=1 Tax=Treponema phagedenis TaxID=162 RepID=UPI0015824B8D|nr:hypothetical protein [Treponema phagedenis]QKS91121.1 hypothetical protein HPJ96_06805 [Treponema phagedenis]